ncbi:FHA domain-containing protein [Rothia aerolata]|uniref:Signal transduction protein n=1 Tax=Rothia aerolata TaxID=1812262 RepID=A0A917ILN9_9MICC|nr:FHA domain-containing protein [Rothia aerolata]GGH56345.1 signal transduction protein [Rothia aerolata]
MTNHEAHPKTSALSTAAINLQSQKQGSFSPNEEELNTIATLPEGSALLIGTNAELRGARFLLNVETLEDGAVKRIVAGRSPNSDIFLNDVTVSRQHAVFVPNAGTFVLTDNNSLNGTYVNGDRVDEAFLKNGAEIRIGKFHFAFFLGTGK